MSWQTEVEEYEDLGHLRIYVTPPNGARVDVTFFRDIPTQLSSYSFSDPYGDSTAQVLFPQIGVMDDLGNGDLSWFAEFSDIDIVLQKTDGTEVVLWEGFMASYDWSHAEGGSQLSVTCQGALFQVDRYVSRPQYPNTPIAHEVLIAEAFDPARHPHLRTQPLVIEWPDNWKVLAYRTAGVVGAQTGGKSTGFKTRVTGAWEKSLTGFVSNLLSVMYTTDHADQWTIRKDAGRQPVMHIRRASRAPDFSLDAGQPGVTINLSRDYTQYANVLYGSGTTEDGSEWSRQSITRDNQRTEYVPMAADPRVTPHTNAFSSEVMRAETHVRFEDGMEVTDALKTSVLMLRRNQDPGYAGNLILTIDPEELSRYEIRAGMCVRLRYFGGTGDAGVKLHISECTINVSDGSVSLTVDSKFRDALTVEETLARTRDPLTPIRMLQIGKSSHLIPDQLAPWSYALGSGYVPATAQAWHNSLREVNEIFPFEATMERYPPRVLPDAYVQINAHSAKRKDRWAGPIFIRLAEKGEIRLSQFALVDRQGKRVRIPFHVSIYKAHVTADGMPWDDQGPSPFIKGAFQDVNEYGYQIGANTPGATAMRQQSLLVGWGDHDQPAGYSPGTKSNGDPATGLLIDETSWSFDMTDLLDFDRNPDPGYRQPETAITAYLLAYAEYHEPVYLTGRLYRKEPGT